MSPAWIWSAYAALFPGQELLGTTPYWLCWAGTGIPLLIAALLAADSIIRRRDPFYDRFAGTRVLRLDRKNAGVAMAAMAPWMWFAGFAGMIALAVIFPNPIILIIVVFAGFETWRRWKQRRAGGAEQEAYYRVSPHNRALVAITYLTLIALLVIGMDATHLARTLV